MANTLYPGDFILLNLAAYKIKTPQEIPIIGLPLQQRNLFETGKPDLNDLIIFKFPLIDDKTSLYSNSSIVKRIIAGPGDTLEIKNKIVFVNGNELNLPPTVNRSFKKIKMKDQEDEGIFYDESGWNSDNYGPIVIPSKGDIIRLNNNTIHRWQRLIAYEYERKVVRLEGSVITIDNHPLREYTVQKDHYFVIGDNYNNSLDSRYFGFINEDMIIGKVLFIYWSSDPALGIRWERIFNSM
jgi:signal peptidase I